MGMVKLIRSDGQSRHLFQFCTGIERLNQTKKKFIGNSINGKEKTAKMRESLDIKDSVYQNPCTTTIRTSYLPPISISKTIKLPPEKTLQTAKIPETSILFYLN